MQVKAQVTLEHSYRPRRSQMGIQPCYSRLIHRLNHWHCLPTAHLLEWHFAHQRGDMPGFIWSRYLLTMGLESSLLKTATDTSFFNRLFLEWEHLLAASAKGLNQLLLVSCKKNLICYSNRRFGLESKNYYFHLPFSGMCIFIVAT